MKAAFVLCGDARSFVKPSVHLSIRNELLDGLCRRECESDVYWYFSEAPVWSGATLAELHTIFQPRRIGIHVTEERRDVCTAPDVPRLDNVNTNFKFYENPREAITIARLQYTKIAAAFQLVTEEERKHNFKYDWIIRTRFDLGWYAPPSSISRFSNDRIYVPSQTWNGVNDQFALVPRGLADLFFDLHQPFRCHNETNLPLWYHTFHQWHMTQTLRDIPVWQPETVLWAHLKIHNIPFARHAFPAAIVRQDGDSRCLELAPHTLLGTLVDASTLDLNKTTYTFQSLAKTAHLAACATRFPCCRIDLDTGYTHFFFDVPPHDSQALETACQSAQLSKDNCQQIRSQLRSHSILSDDASIQQDLSLLVQRRRSRQQSPMALRVETMHNTQNTPKTILIDSKALADLWDALICTYIHLWPRAEAIAASTKSLNLTSLLELDCAGMPDYLLASDRWLHSFLDDTSLTWPSYASLTTGNLGWQVRTLDTDLASSLLAEYNAGDQLPPINWINTIGLLPARSTWSTFSLSLSSFVQKSSASVSSMLDQRYYPS